MTTFIERRYFENWKPEAAPVTIVQYNENWQSSPDAEKEDTAKYWHDLETLLAKNTFELLDKCAGIFAESVPCFEVKNEQQAAIAASYIAAHLVQYGWFLMNSSNAKEEISLLSKKRNLFNDILFSEIVSSVLLFYNNQH